MTADPEHIAISKSKGFQIDWKDGAHTALSCAELRDNCPCAVCTGAHGTEPQKTEYSQSSQSASDPFPMFKPAIQMLNVEPVGNYAIRIYWNDKHSSGIYTWEHLRSLKESAAPTEVSG